MTSEGSGVSKKEEFLALLKEAIENGSIRFIIDTKIVKVFSSNAETIIRRVKVFINDEEVKKKEE